MNQKEVSELRRRWRLEKNAVSRIYGCFVNGNREIVSDLDESLGRMSEEEADKYLSLLKKSLSGALGKNLIDIVFSTQQVQDSEEHRLLSALRSSVLKDGEVRNHFYRKVIDSLDMGGDSYLLLMACDAYDVPRRGKDDELLDDGLENVFSYILCCICPVKQGKPVLGYFPGDNEFHYTASHVVSPPELGFLFPAFDDRCANLYSALYYSKRAEENHPEFIDSVFRVEPPMPAAVQQETFRTLLAESLGDQCSYDVVQGVTDRLREMVDNHKARKDPEPLVVSKRVLSEVLRDCEVEEEKISAFAQQYEEEFGEQAVSPKNLIDQKETQVRTPNILIKVEADFAHLVETRLIDGKKYILIRAEDGVEVNGVAVSVTE